MNIAKYLVLFLFVGLSIPAISAEPVTDIKKIRYIYELDEKAFTPADLNMVGKAIGLTFPKGSQGINLVFRGEYEPSFLAKIRIYEPAHEEFIKQMEKMRDGGGTITDEERDKLSWWKVSPKTLYMKRLYDRSAGIMLWLCKENGEWILYVEWMTV